MIEHLYSVSAVIVTINGGMDDDHYVTNLQSKFKQWVYQKRYTNYIDYIRHFRI